MSQPTAITSSSGTDEVDAYFLRNSYVRGYTYSEDDKTLYKRISEKIDNDKHVNAARWASHIKAINDDPKLNKIHSAKADMTPDAKTGGDNDDEIDLFGDDDDDEEEMEKLRMQRAKDAADKKKKDVVAKSLVVLDVKPWDDTTSLEEIKKCVLSIEQDGLIWGTAKFEPLSYGIMKLRIACAIEDEKVSVDELSSRIEEEFSELVQSVDVASFNKI